MYRDRSLFGGGAFIRIAIGFIVAIFSLIGYFTTSSKNEITGKKQHISITPQQEIAMGLQALPSLERQYGGMETDKRAEAIVDAIGPKIVSQSDAGKTPYKFDFHVLNDEKTLNAFALPGGQVFITSGLLNRLQTVGQLAGVLGHEIGHVVARHSAEQLAKQQLTSGLTSAAVIATYDPNNRNSRYRAMVAQAIGQLVNMKFGRNDELEADRLGVRFMSEAGYDPRAMIGVMEILDKATKSGRPPEFFSTHPNPSNRITNIQNAIKRQYPAGIPENMQK